MENNLHIPVLLDQVIEWLQAKNGGTFFDGTLGLGGHTKAVLAASPNNFVYATDKDQEALDMAKKNLEMFNGRFRFFHSDFRALPSLPIDIPTIDGFLFDLGVSSFQLDTPGRGFSYSQPAPLDMRMDKDKDFTAEKVINFYSHSELCALFKRYGEFQNPTKLVDQIIFHRKNNMIDSSSALKEIVRRVFPKQKTMDPLSRIFQALRIEVNGELDNLESFFSNLITQLKPGARLLVISFHSLEDRIAKTAMKKGAKEKLVEILTKKPIEAGEIEKKDNARSRSAKLRVCRKI